MENTPNGAPKTPMWKRFLALAGVAAVIGFVLWLAVTMLTMGG